MITATAIEQADHLTYAVNFTKQKLSAATSSPLTSLAATLVSLNDDGSNTELIRQSIQPGTSLGTFDEVLEYNSQKIANIMANIVNVAKNVVNPHCRSIVEAIKAARQEKVLIDVGLLGEIKLIDLPDVFNNSMMIELIDPYKNTPASVIMNTRDVFAFIEKEMSLEDKVQLIKTGSDALDSKIEAYLNGQLADAVSSALVGGDGLSLDVAELTTASTLVYFLLAQGIQNEKSETATALMANSSMKLTVTELKAACAGKLFRDSDSYDNALKNKEIIARPMFHTAHEDNVLYVYGVTYRNWIQETNGSPEAALGYLASRGHDFTLGGDLDLRTNPDKYRAEYEGRLAHAKSKAILDDIRLVRQTTGYHMADAISRMEDVDRPSLQKKLAEALEHEYHGANMLNEYVIKVVSRTLTEGPDVKDILLEVESILSDMDQPDMKYAVYIASVRLVGRWIRSQLTLQPI